VPYCQRKIEAEADRDDVVNTAIMSTSFWWTLPPLPKQKRGKRPAEPGFTDEELQYLENTLQIIESISIDTLGLNETEDVNARQAGAEGARSSQSYSDVQGRPNSWNRVHSVLSDVRLWAVTHPNTVAVFLVFLAGALLTHTNMGGIQTLAGLACLFAGLKIMAATEDGFELPPRSHLPTLPSSQHLENDQES